MEDKLFKEGLREGDLSKIRKASKVDVHNHWGLGMRFSTFNKWAGGNVKEPPKKINGIDGMNNYIFNETMKLITEEEDLEYLMEQTVKEAVEDGVKVLEPSIDCSNITFFQEDKGLFNGILKIKEKYKDIIDLRPEVGMTKTIPDEKLNRLLIPCIESGVFNSIDLYGDEVLDNFQRFKEYYKYAKEKGLKLKVHAGEFEGAENVKKAVEILDVDEIQHGIGASSSDYVMNIIKERNITLNVCPSSNIILGAVKDIRKYPARTLFDKGINITINTDDLLLFNSGVSEEYLYLYNSGVFNEYELNEIRKKSL